MQGVAFVATHSGPRYGLDYTTIEAETFTLTHDKLVVPLLGGLDCLRQWLMSKITHTEAPMREG